MEVGDTVGSIALKFNSTTDAILKDNNIKDANSILPGQVLIIEVNLVTPIPSKTAVPPSPTGPTPTSTRAATFTPRPYQKTLIADPLTNPLPGSGGGILYSGKCHTWKSYHRHISAYCHPCHDTLA